MKHEGNSDTNNRALETTPKKMENRQKKVYVRGIMRPF